MAPSAAVSQLMAVNGPLQRSAHAWSKLRLNDVAY